MQRRLASNRINAPTKMRPQDSRLDGDLCRHHHFFDLLFEQAGLNCSHPIRSLGRQSIKIAEGDL